MSEVRRRTITEQVGDIKERLENLEIFENVLKSNATLLKQLLANIGSLTTLPAAIVTVGPGDYPDNDPDAPAQRDRELQLGIVCVGEYQADIDDQHETVWDLLDTVDRSFTPGNGANGDGTISETEPTTINGVEYTPLTVRPVAAGDDRSAYSLVLQAIDTVQTRDEV